MDNFEECPKCGRAPGIGMYFAVFECKKCGVQYCEECGKDGACPDCKSNEKEEAGECRVRN